MLDCFLYSVIEFTNDSRFLPGGINGTLFFLYTNQCKKLNIFLKHMPKGGDLHLHISGSCRAEDLINYAMHDHLCVNKQFVVHSTAKCPTECLLERASEHPQFFNSLIDAWSMRHFHSGNESAHDHFFSAFTKFFLITSRHAREMIRDIVKQACQENIVYLELMVMPDNNASGQLGKGIPWDVHFNRLRAALFKKGLIPIVIHISQQLDKYDQEFYRCVQSCIKKKNTCKDIKLRYLYSVLREQPPTQIFSQLLAGFELSARDSRVLGINLVAAEDGKIALRDYTLQMHMIEFLHSLYPQVHISLHAGELTPALAPLKELRFHIRQAVEIAHAERIGHGVDIVYEDRNKQLLKKMAQRSILVETNLSSNAAILNLKGQSHPLLFYRRHKVPISLSTDDRGILRTNLTEQYRQAVLSYHFSYRDLKILARNSIRYSFLPRLEKASLQKKLEYEFLEFEKQFIKK